MTTLSLHLSLPFQKDAFFSFQEDLCAAINPQRHHRICRGSHHSHQRLQPHEFISSNPWHLLDQTGDARAKLQRLNYPRLGGIGGRLCPGTPLVVEARWSCWPGQDHQKRTSWSQPWQRRQRSTKLEFTPPPPPNPK